ncbi:MAG: hypothetical protein PHY02_07535 [Phycisphaerae bacterium]|nr:hypothetical protein [Phycisphaerae bacterium]
MNYKLRTKPGLSLMEEIVVIAIIALLVVFGLPAARSLYKSVEAESGGKAMISAAFSAARAIAAKEQRYAGVRFQYAYYKDDPNNAPLKASQYMIFIIYQPRKNLSSQQTDGDIFTAVKGIKPIKLPDSVGVMDLNLGSPNPDQIVDNDNRIDSDWELIDTTSFSIVFSPSGKLTVRTVQTRNRKGVYRPSDPVGSWYDDIFNSIENIRDNNIGQFVQDDYSELGLVEEPSRRSFIIYDRTVFEKANPARRYTDYLKYFVDNHKETYINPYTGTMIEQ